MRMLAGSIVATFFLAISATVWAEKPEGELNPDLTNPGSVEFPGWFKNSFLDIAEDVNEAAGEKKSIMLFFYQDGCPYCKKTIEVNFAQKNIAEKTQQKFSVIAINMWGDRELTWVNGETMKEKDFAVKMRVMFTPTLIFVDAHKNIALRINGYYNPQKFNAALDYVSLGKYGEMAFSEYINSIKPAPSAGKLHGEPFISAPPYDFSKLERPQIVLFEQKDCPACDELHNEVFKRPETLQEIKPYKVAQLNMWSDDYIITPTGKKTTARKWAKALDIKYAPSMVFFDKSGKEIIRTEAYLKSFHIQSVMEYVSSGAYQKYPSFQRYIEDRAAKLREKGVEINIMK